MKPLETQLKSILAYIKGFFPKPGYEKISIQPSKDWKYILLFFATGLVVIVIVGSYMYVNVLNGSFWDSGSVDQSATLNTINQKNLDAVTVYFDGKAVDLNTAQNGLQSVPDPSL